jgi:hypothetical protein
MEATFYLRGIERFRRQTQLALLMGITLEPGRVPNLETPRKASLNLQ